MKIFIGQKPDPQHMQALVRCKLGDNGALLDLFRKKLEHTKDALVLADDLVLVHRLQGRAEVLADFLEAVEKSSEIFDRVK
jgi:hypothetical protein